MERMNLDGTSVAVGMVAGLALGGVSGYLLYRHLDRTRCEERIEAEVQATRDFYKARTGQASLGTRKPQDFRGTAAYLDEEVSDGPEDNDEDDDVDPESVLEDDEEDEDEDGWPPANRDRSKPYVISVVEFADRSAGDGWQQLAVTWFAQDNALIDEFEKPIPDIIRTTGPLSIRLFEEESRSGDPTRVYIRNEPRKIDFEVILNRSSYADVILNYGNPRSPGG